ncbi:MAG TPA: hypothetical protein VLB84_13130 [Bacteroidia bacterium]|nr:hypothetical protein [Bacteroidia bacterium]
MMANTPNLTGFIQGYQAAIKDSCLVLEQWGKRVLETKETDVLYVLQEIQWRIDELRMTINNLVDRV